MALYWPEFEQGGKGAITVRDALTHQAGVPGFDPVLTFEDLKDWGKVTANIAAQTHRFGGERKVCYHLSTYGFILGELIRRVDGRWPARFFREEIADRTGADFQIALGSKADMPRLADLRWPAELAPPPADDDLRTYVLDSLVFGPDNSFETNSAELPSGSGKGNARSIARVCAILAMGGELDGERYMSRAMADEAGREQVFAEDPFFGWIKFGLGFGLHNPMFPAPSPTAFHWGGYGGSWALVDQKGGVSLGYAPNNLRLDVTLSGVDPRLDRISGALEKLLPGL